MDVGDKKKTVPTPIPDWRLTIYQVAMGGISPNSHIPWTSNNALRVKNINLLTNVQV